MGIETDTNQFKLGDGSLPWNSLPYGGIQGPPGTAAGISSFINTSSIFTSTLTADSNLFFSSINLQGALPGFFANTLNYISTTAATAVSFNTATNELGYSDFLQLSSFVSLSTIQTSSLLLTTTFNGVESTSKLTVSANTLLFNDAPIVAGALTSLPSTLSTLDFYTSSIQASTLSLYNDSDSNFPVLTLSSAYLLLNGQYMSSIASGGIASIPGDLSSFTFQTSTIQTSSLQTSTLSLYNDSDSNYPILTLSSGYLLLDGQYMSSIASGGLANIPSTLSTVDIYTSTIYASTTNTAEVILSTTTSTGRLFADDTFLYFNQTPLNENYASSFSTAAIYVSSLFVSSIVSPNILQVQFYTF
jgi:hypothetical protein